MNFKPTFDLGQSNDAYAEYFSGKSWVALLTDPKRTSAKVINVTFEPGCRNNWHILTRIKGVDRY